MDVKSQRSLPKDYDSTVQTSFGRLAEACLISTPFMHAARNGRLVAEIEGPLCTFAKHSTGLYNLKNEE